MKCVALSTYEWSTVVGGCSDIGEQCYNYHSYLCFLVWERREERFFEIWNQHGTPSSVLVSLSGLLSLVLLLLRLYSCGQFTANGGRAWNEVFRIKGAAVGFFSLVGGKF